MRLGGILVTICAGLTVTACATGPARLTDIEFVWGCWAQKNASDGKTEALLRIVPDRDRSNFSGFIDKILLPGDETILSFASDGSSAGLDAYVSGDDDDLEAAVPPPSRNFVRDYRAGPRRGEPPNLVVFRSTANKDETLTAQGTGSTLKISRTFSGGSTETLFEGARNGCD